MTLLEFIRYCSSVPFMVIFIYLVVEKRYSAKWTVLLLSCCTLLIVSIIVGLFTFYSSDLIRMLFPIVETIPILVVSALVSKQRDLRALFVGLTAAVFCLMTEVLADLLFLLWSNISANIIIKAMLYIMILVLIATLVRKPFLMVIDQLAEGWGLLCTVPLFYMMTLYCLTDFPTSLIQRPENALALLFLILSIYACYFLIYKMFQQAQQHFSAEQGRSYLQIQVNALKNQQSAVYESAEQLRIYRHDLRHYVQLIHLHMESGDYSAAKDAILKMDGMVSETTVRRYCLNLDINAIVAYYAERAESAGITVTTHLDIPENLKVDAMELSVVFANLMENALHACERIPEGDRREIDLLSRKIDSQLLIEIANTYKGELLIDSSTGLPLTREKGHGIGLRSVLTFVKKYDVIIDSSTEDGWFEFRMLFSDI